MQMNLEPDKRNGQSVSGCNVQIANDDKHKLLASTLVTNQGNESDQLAPMPLQAKANLGADKKKSHQRTSNTPMTIVARNPFLNHPLMRKGGVHQKSKSSERSQARRETKQLARDWHSWFIINMIPI